MTLELRCALESWPLAAPFRISRGVKTAADVVVVEIIAREPQGEWRGRGEAVPYARYGETPESVLAAIECAGAALETVEGNFAALRGRLQGLLPAGAARNALDTALWDLEAQRHGGSVAERLGGMVPGAISTAYTVSLDSPQRMAQAAARVASMPLIKVKVDASDPVAQLTAVHAAAPLARLIVDANEGWSFPLLQSMQDVLAANGAVLLEQPLPAGADAVLEGFVPRVPICADESCHTIVDLPQVRRRYQAVNVKLDKAGGLTAAHELVHAARLANLQVMIGCMVCTSLGIAPALQLASLADFVDLDGPLLLARDREGGVTLVEGCMHPPGSGFWGDGARRMLG